ncbi:NGFI-A-binding protein homolog isoform X2 [Brevipalpus obovatus]|uniref:NGFI-A-binding protein homolog isoform X2 n=1 Tax=Brevipalpus obovatus TaxID=246614 RepID=UPI003D9E0BF4
MEEHLNHRPLNQCNSVASMQSNGHSGVHSRSTLGHSSSMSISSQGSSSIVNHHPSMANPLFATNRMLSRNSNGTIAMTFEPSNESELQLYRVLQRSNLLSYYDTFISQGGDDVQQLCDAGEEEFLEIMALVGMANKPLHVRRLQKVLQEWVSNPTMFRAPLTHNFGPSGPIGPHPSIVHPSLTLTANGPLLTAAAHSTPSSSSSMVDRRSPVNLTSQATSAINALPSHSIAAAAAAVQSLALHNSSSSSSSPASLHPHLNSHQHQHPHPHQTSSSTLSLNSHNNSVSGRLQANSSPSDGTKENNVGSNNHNSATISVNHAHIQSNHLCGHPASIGLVTNEYGQPASPISLTPVLVETQVQRLAETAEAMVRRIAPLDPKDPKITNNKKKYAKELEIIGMSEDDPRRVEEIRKYAVIYGRFDCKRDSAKPLTLHEVSVNEAAVQICKLIPTFLMRREELFALARQVVRESGYQYSKGHSRSQGTIRLSSGTILDSLSDSLMDQDSSHRYKRRLTDSPIGQNNSLRKGGNISDSSNDQRISHRFGKRLRPAESPANLQERIQFTQEERKRRQERLENVIEQLKSLGSQQEALKLQLQQAREAQNFSGVNQFQSELDQLSTQQMQLINERSEIDKQLRKLERHQAELNRGFTDEKDSQYSVYSNESSPSINQDNRLGSPIQEGSSQNSDNFAKLLPSKKNSPNQGATNQLTRQLVREALIDEGLRVVKEFADQSKGEDSSNGIDLRIGNSSLSVSGIHLGTPPKSSNLNGGTSGGGSPQSNRSTPNSNGQSPLGGSLAAINAVAGNHNVVGSRATTACSTPSSTSITITNSPRPRGRPPKYLATNSVDRESFYLTTNGNGMLPYNHHSSNQSSNQMIINSLANQQQQSASFSAPGSLSNGFRSSPSLEASHHFELYSSSSSSMDNGESSSPGKASQNGDGERIVDNSNGTMENDNCINQLTEASRSSATTDDLLINSQIKQENFRASTTGSSNGPKLAEFDKNI